MVEGLARCGKANCWVLKDKIRMIMRSQLVITLEGSIDFEGASSNNIEVLCVGWVLCILSNISIFWLILQSFLDDLNIFRLCVFF